MIPSPSFLPYTPPLKGGGGIREESDYPTLIFKVAVSPWCIWSCVT